MADREQQSRVRPGHKHIQPLSRVSRRLQTGVIYHPVHGYPIPPPVPVAVSRRNARERTRVKTVNDSYQHLKAHVPAAARTKRMSKVDIIKHSIEYIQKLQTMVSAAQLNSTNTSSQDQLIVTKILIQCNLSKTTRNEQFKFYLVSEVKAD